MSLMGQEVINKMPNDLVSTDTNTISLFGRLGDTRQLNLKGDAAIYRY